MEAPDLLSTGGRAGFLGALDGFEKTRDALGIFDYGLGKFAVSKVDAVVLVLDRAASNFVVQRDLGVGVVGNVRVSLEVYIQDARPARRVQ